jgi:threonine/homoserine/homoserine lactone efflux protein
VTWAAFASVVLIHLIAAIAPGPSFVVSVRTAANDGFGAAVGLALGFGFGAVLWAATAMAGLAVLFELVPVLFTALKLVGAAFLMFIAVMMWRGADAPLETPIDNMVSRTFGSAVKFGFFTFATNPKPAIFFAAVFVGLVPADTPLVWKASILAAVFVNEFTWYVIVVRVFSFPKARAGYIRLKSGIDRVFGTLIALFGLKIALT